MQASTHVHVGREEINEEGELDEVEEGDADGVEDALERVDDGVEDPVGEPLSDLAAVLGGGITGALQDPIRMRDDTGEEREARNCDEKPSCVRKRRQA